MLWDMMIKVLSSALFLPQIWPQKTALMSTMTDITIALIEIFEKDYPAIKALIGEKTFDNLCRAYIDAFPSTHYDICIAGRHMAKYLKNHANLDPFYTDLATFEWGLDQTLWTADLPGISFDEIAAIPPGILGLYDISASSLCAFVRIGLQCGGYLGSD